MDHETSDRPFEADRAQPDDCAVLRDLIPAGGRPVALDIGCGKGRFLRARAGAFPETRFIGIDRLSARLRLLAGRAARDGLENVRLLRCDAYGALRFFLPPASITACTILFPDPWPKRRHHRRRLITPAFLEALRAIMIPGGRVDLATDHAGYFLAIARAFRSQAAWRQIPPLVFPAEQRTDFELVFANLNRRIHRCAYARID